MESNDAMKAWKKEPSFLSNVNQGWIEQLYEDFLINPDSVHLRWRSIFSQLLSMGVTLDQCHSELHNYFHCLAKNDIARCSSVIFDPYANEKQVRVLQLINAYRFCGYQHANLDPLGLWKQEYVEILDPEYHDLTKADLQEIFNVGSFSAEKEPMKLDDIINMLKKIYCDSIGAEYMYITSTEEKQWIQERIECVSNYTFSVDEKKRLLSELTAAEEIERYMGIKFPGEKRFSLEGGDALVPMLKELIRYAGNSGTREIVFGMAHRGRLNVLVNVLGKKTQDLFDEFSGKYKKYLGMGDMIYHMGFSSDIETEGGLIHLRLVFNPSHLEIVNPVVIGSVRTRMDRLDNSIRNKIIPVTIHGDAAVTGQGVVQETLNMSKTRGYEVGGTIRIVINNQMIGFTTSNLLEARSTPYYTDIGNMIQAPIFHVNADDPEAAIFIVRLALDYRNTFKKDVFIDLFCYRRHGHNKLDEPRATQPIMYQKIKNHLTIRNIYANKLEKEKIVMIEDATEIVKLYRDMLDAGKCVVKESRQMNMHSFIWSPYLNHKWNDKYPNKVKTKRLQELAKCISTVPSTIEMQSRVAKIYADRKSMAVGKNYLIGDVLNRWPMPR